MTQRAAAGTERRRLPYLDGIRAFAVGAVILFHAGVPGVEGGLLGVDVFFVLSGYLITSLLCGEHRRSSSIALGRFWAARARRLLPGLFILLLGVAAYASAFSGSVDVSEIRADALSTLFYFANWHFVFSAQGYFAQSMTPSPLLHMWSLSVEEQYYLIWPLVAFVVLRRRGAGALARVAAVGAAASATLAFALFRAGFSIDRIYYGTDTRAQALLVGSVLGAIASGRNWRVVPVEWARTRVGTRVGAAIGLCGAAALLWFWHSVDGQGAFLYEGGFLIVAIAAAAVITAVTSWPTSLLARLLSLRPLTYVGRISYGLYLYHWPLFLAIDHAHTGLSGAELLGARLVATFAAAIASFHLVELPIRRGALVRGWRGALVGAAGATATAAVLVAATVLPVPQTASATASASTSDATNISALEHSELDRAGAFTKKPIRFLLVGDSVAVTATDGLSVDDVSDYGVLVVGGGLLGCDLDITPYRLGGVVYYGGPKIDCGSWRAGWRDDVNFWRPDVVGILMGRFMVADHYYDGQWMHVGEPVWDAHIEGELDQAITILSSRGAHVVLFTFPYIDPPIEQANGDPYPENEPQRMNALNADFRRVAAAHPKSVTLIDLNRILDPQGQFTNTIDGVQVRWPDDGIHISKAGGEWLRPKILPEIAQLGLDVRSAKERSAAAAGPAAVPGR